jgi:hypothetical protein
VPAIVYTCGSVMERTVVPGAGGLADGPRQSKVADGRNDGRRCALKQRDTEAAPRFGESMGEVADAGADNGQVRTKGSTLLQRSTKGRRRGR